MRIGFHIPTAGGLNNVIKEALERRCQTVQIFASAPVQWKTRHFSPQECADFAAALDRFDLRPLFVHAPYLLNLASPNKTLREKSQRRLISDMHWAHAWRAVGVVLHLGSAGPRGDKKAALQRVIRALHIVLQATESPTHIILENSAGQGHTIGHSIEEIAYIIEKTETERLGLALDTAHAFAAGYPVHTQAGLDDLCAIIEQQMGLQRLLVIHANDLRGALGSRKDRHWHIGQGSIGPSGWRIILAHEKLRALPFIMETPKGLSASSTLEADLRNLRSLRRYIPAELRPPLPSLPWPQARRRDNNK